MIRRRSVVEKLRRAWYENPGTVEDVARMLVPEANEREVSEVAESVPLVGVGRDHSIAATKMTRGKGAVPGGQQRVVRNPILEDWQARR